MRGLMKLWMAIGAVLVAVGALGNMPSASAASAAGAAAAEPSNIQIVQTPSGGGGICLPPALAMRQSTRSDATTFRLIIRVTAPLCARVNAVAAIYKMPGNGVAWPQTLLETAPFSLREPGTTEVIFTKTCTPAQFDVITGATPPVISPTGPWHGPLLFPFDTATSLQYFGDPSCNPTTTTTASTTTTSTPEVNGSTTVPVSSTTPPPEVESVTTLPASVAGTTQEPAQLALTGSGTRWGALVGASMIAAGAAMLLMSRRRSQAPADA